MNHFSLDMAVDFSLLFFVLLCHNLLFLTLTEIKNLLFLIKCKIFHSVYLKNNLFVNYVIGLN